MRVLITIAIVVFFAGTAPVISPWTVPAIAIFFVLGVAGLGVLFAMWIPQYCNTAMRVTAGMVGLLMTASAVDFVISQLQAGGSLFGLRTPLVGLFILGIPAFVYAYTGKPETQGLFQPKSSSSVSDDKEQDQATEQLS